MDMEKIKEEARQKIINEEEAIVRDYYVRLLNEEKRLKKEHLDALKFLDEKEAMLDNKEFEIKNTMETNGLTIVFR